ncbi:MAG: leukocidin family pore-forming toxin [Candidatus Fimenecus sp.]
MKKILAVVMALTMLFALCVPAFAATGTIDENTADPKEAVVPVKTTYSTSDESFTVTYPATMDIPWGTLVDDANAAFEYSVVSQLQTGKTITVAVTPTNTVMTSAASETLAYTLAGDVNVTTGAAVVAADDFVKAVKVNVAQSAWDAAAINEYTDTVTFAVTVNAAP